MKKVLFAFILSVSFGLSGLCQGLIDKAATEETKWLYHNLKTISRNHILFGHQHATEYGHGWAGDEDRSDVKSVTGSDPAIIGVDIMQFSGTSQEETYNGERDVEKEC